MAKTYQATPKAKVQPRVFPLPRLKADGTPEKDKNGRIKRIKVGLGGEVKRYFPESTTVKEIIKEATPAQYEQIYKQLNGDTDLIEAVDQAVSTSSKSK